MVSNLIVLMNGQRVGLFTKASNGAHSFTYDRQWIESDNTRPISLSMPLRGDAYTGNEVINFFDNLLPDNQNIRERIVFLVASISLIIERSGTAYWLLMVAVNVVAILWCFKTAKKEHNSQEKNLINVGK